MRGKLVRLTDLPDKTFGAMLFDNIPMFVTLERPWDDNRVDTSCIPAGTYTCRRHKSPKFGETFIVADVEGRGQILFHWGNFVSDTQGCILIGKSYGLIWKDGIGQRGVASSCAAFYDFMKSLEGIDSFELEIVNIDQ